MKVLFLDVDGVLNSENVLSECVPGWGRPGSAWLVGEEQMRFLKEIVDRTGCSVVISSTWRLYPEGLSFIEKFFRDIGVPKFIGVTPNLGWKPRHLEIQQWLDENKVENFCIVDDDPDAEISGHFVKTVFKDGLTKEKAEEIISTLGARSEEHI